MYNHWILKDSRNKLVICTNDSLYFGSPKDLYSPKTSLQLNRGEIPKGLFSLPFNYIKEVKNQEGKSKLIIEYNKDSEEELSSKDLSIKDDIFNHLQQRLESFDYISKNPTIWAYSKTQIFAIILPLALFLWTLYLAIEIEKGAEYEIVGGRAGIAGIVLGLAQFGILKVIIGYLPILLLGIFSFIKKIKNRSEIRSLKRIK